MAKELSLVVTRGENLVESATGDKTRDMGISYDEFITSSYANEMKRRLEYYNGSQFCFDPTYTENLPVGTTITPSEWNSSMSGYGWEDIRAMLPDATREQCIHPVGIPFVTIVVDNKQVVYTVPPEKRTFYKDGKADEDASKLLEAIYTSCKHDHLSDQLCKWTGLFDTAFQFVGWDVRNRRIVKRNLRPYEVFVIPSPEAPDDIQHPDAFVAIAQLDLGLTDREAPQRELVWQCWWKDRFWYESSPRAEYKDAACTIRGTNKNPYTDMAGNPVKPILVTHSTEATEIYYKATDNLVLLNQRLDRDLTSISHTMEFQGFAFLVFKGMDATEVKGISPSAGSTAALPNGAEAEYLHPVVQVGEFFAAIINKARAFARLVGIDPELVDPKVDAQSGVSKAQGRRALAERREEQFPKWVPYERESYWLVSTVWNYHSKGVKDLPEIPRYESPLDDTTYNIEVVFGELDPVVDPLADTQEKLQKLKAHLLTREEILASERRISNTAAKTLAAEIKKKNEADGITMDVSEQGSNVRIGQPGNRPTNPNRPRDKTGGNVTGSSGNTSIKPTPQKRSQN